MGGRSFEWIPQKSEYAVLDRMHYLLKNACMPQVTIRRVDEACVAKAKAEAKLRGISMNEVLRESLRRGLGVEGERPCNGLEKFAGSLPFESGEEEAGWNEAMRDFEQIDEALWK